MDTQHPQIETTPTYRVRFRVDGILMSSFEMCQDLDVVRDWAAGQLRRYNRDEQNDFWAAVIESGHILQDPFSGRDDGSFLPDRIIHEGILLSYDILFDPRVSTDHLFGIKRSANLS